MGDREAQSGVPEVVGGAGAAPPQLLAAQFRALADIARALADLARALGAQVRVISAQTPAGQAQTLEDDVERAESSVFAYTEITNLQDINENYPIHKLALEDWERKEKDLSNSISHKEGHCVQLTNQIFSILGIFAIFQGVVLIAVSQLTQNANTDLGGASLCRKTWFPIVLTGFATLVTILGIVYKFTCLRSFESAISQEKQAKNEITRRKNALLREGSKDFKFHLHANNFIYAPESKLVKKRFWVIVFLVIFTLIFILSYFVIFCNSWVG